jgi:hypothetical protein
MDGVERAIDAGMYSMTGVSGGHCGTRLEI